MKWNREMALEWREINNKDNGYNERNINKLIIIIVMAA